MTKEYGQPIDQFIVDNREEWPVCCALLDFLDVCERSMHTTQSLSEQWNARMKRVDSPQAHEYATAKQEYDLLRQQVNDRIVCIDRILNEVYLQNLRNTRIREVAYFNELTNLLENPADRKFWSEKEDNDL